MLPEVLLQALNAQLTWERFSEALYLALAAVCDAASYGGFAAYLRARATEEQQHAQRLAQFILDRNAAPVYDALAAASELPNTPVEIFRYALAHEQQMTQRIAGLLDVAESVKDRATCAFLNYSAGDWPGYVLEQVEEERTLTEIIARLERATDEAAVLLIEAQLVGGVR